MAICPYCALEFYLENEDDLEKGDIVNCDECGATLEVARTSELELRLVSDDDDPEAEEETEADEEDDDDLDEDDSYDEDFSDNGYYDVEEDEEEAGKPPVSFRGLAIVTVVALLGGAIVLDAAGKKKQAEPEAIIAGTVFQASGHLLRGAKVEAVAQGDPKVKGSTVTDAQGDFAIRVPAGQRTYAVTASAKGFEPAQKTVEVYESEKVRTNLILSPEPNK